MTTEAESRICFGYLCFIGVAQLLVVSNKCPFASLRRPSAAPAARISHFGLTRGDFMQASLKKSLQLLLFSVAATAIASPALAQTTGATTPTPALQYAKQGWSVEDRQTFYTTSQGSHMIPYLWFKALRRLDADEPFGGDQLARYGYLPNEKSKLNPEGLPVGFVLDGDARTGFFGMTCAACHTAQIKYQKDGATQQLRIDGAPATANFQLFLTDLEAAAKETIKDTNRLEQFARSVLG